MREKQKQNFDKRHQVQDLRPLVPGDSVWPPEIYKQKEQLRKKSHLDPIEYLHHMDYFEGNASI